MSIAHPHFPSSAEGLFVILSLPTSLRKDVGTLREEWKGLPQTFPVAVQQLVENLLSIRRRAQAPTAIFGKQNTALWITRSARSLQQEVIDPEVEPVLRFDRRTSIVQKMAGPHLADPTGDTKAGSREVEIHGGQWLSLNQRQQRIHEVFHGSNGVLKNQFPGSSSWEESTPAHCRICFGQTFASQFPIHQFLLKPVSVERMNRKWLTSVGQLLVFLKPQAQTPLQKISCRISVEPAEFGQIYLSKLFWWLTDRNRNKWLADWDLQM
jgi:hypothetical protein